MDIFKVADPEGIARETFHTLDSIPIYGDDTVMAPTNSACCAALNFQRVNVWQLVPCEPCR